MVQPGNNESLRAKLAGTNINEITFLATDYLNHFNEVIMLIDMIPDVPECLEDAREWHPKSYIGHFEDSSFSDRALAIEAYHSSPLRYRKPLDEVSRLLNEKIESLITGVEALVAEEQPDECAGLIQMASHEIKLMIQLASAVINGTSDVTTAAEVGELLAQTGSDAISQDEIDKLF